MEDVWKIDTMKTSIEEDLTMMKEGAMNEDQPIIDMTPANMTETIETETKITQIEGLVKGKMAPRAVSHQRRKMIRKCMTTKMVIEEVTPTGVEIEIDTMKEIESGLIITTETDTTETLTGKEILTKSEGLTIDITMKHTLAEEWRVLVTEDQRMMMVLIEAMGMMMLVTGAIVRALAEDPMIGKRYLILRFLEINERDYKINVFQ